MDFIIVTVTIANIQKFFPLQAYDIIFVILMAVEWRSYEYPYVKNCDKCILNTLPNFLSFVSISLTSQNVNNN